MRSKLPTARPEPETAAARRRNEVMDGFLRNCRPKPDNAGAHGRY
jgi:hypothetical protein